MFDLHHTCIMTPPFILLTNLLKVEMAIFFPGCVKTGFNFHVPASM